MWKMKKGKLYRYYTAEFPNGDVAHISVWLDDNGFPYTDPILGGPYDFDYSDSAEWVLKSGNRYTFKEALDAVYELAESFNAWDPDCWNDEGHVIFTAPQMLQVVY